MSYGNIWDGKFGCEPTRQYRISFCTTCMGRLCDLQETLPQNIKDNSDYKDLEFVILDYNSRDNLWDWMQKNMQGHIEAGRVTYYRTTEPTYFSMSHSRNIAFKLATGDIVNNLDADNFTRNPAVKLTECWASYLNRLANHQSEKVIFAKGKRGMHGRIGFYKNDFINLLGGYDEDLLGYGHDDHDLVQRAWALGFTMYWWGGQYIERIRTSRASKNAHLERPWRITETENKTKSARNIAEGRLRANEGQHWGKAKLVKNFTEEIEI
jgi:hypothetical protein